MKSIKETVISEIEINKSVFINYLIPVNSVEDVQTNLEQLKARYSDANHHCYAYIIGEHQEIQKYSDDGEPSKTAGMPMMAVLKKNELTNVLTVSIRYFGGIKLGAGGLVRAYTKSCASSVNNASFTTLETFHKLEIIIPFDEIGHIEKYIRDHFMLLDTTYDSFVHYFIVCKLIETESVITSIIEKTSGKGQILTLETIKKYV
jgi:uncharacterized YigZ family protein